MSFGSFVDLCIFEMVQFLIINPELFFILHQFWESTNR